MSQQPEISSPSYILQVEFSWAKLKSIITKKGDPKSRPIYIVDYKTLTPTFIFRSGVDNSAFASGTLHPISINADCNIRGQPITLNALKRFKTEYTHLSRASFDTDSPVPMTWIATCNLKTWDFICLDSRQMPVAKFSANLWTLKKVGNIEFMGEKTATSEAARQEIIVTGMTLMYTMAIRTSSLFSFFGAFFARTGPIDEEKNTPKAIEA